jgi:hypothetical protein
MNRKTASDLLVHTTEQNLAAVHQGDIAALALLWPAEDGTIPILCSFALASGKSRTCTSPAKFKCLPVGSSEPESAVAHNINQRVLI